MKWILIFPVLIPACLFSQEKSEKNRFIDHLAIDSYTSYYSLGNKDSKSCPSYDMIYPEISVALGLEVTPFKPHLFRENVKCNFSFSFGGVVMPIHIKEDLIPCPDYGLGSGTEVVCTPNKLDVKTIAGQSYLNLKYRFFIKNFVIGLKFGTAQYYSNRFEEEPVNCKITKWGYEQDSSGYYVYHSSTSYQTSYVRPADYLNKTFFWCVGIEAGYKIKSFLLTAGFNKIRHSQFKGFSSGLGLCYYFGKHN